MNNDEAYIKLHSIIQSSHLYEETLEPIFMCNLHTYGRLNKCIASLNKECSVPYTNKSFNAMTPTFNNCRSIDKLKKLQRKRQILYQNYKHNNQQQTYQSAVIFLQEKVSYVIVEAAISVI